MALLPPSRRKRVAQYPRLRQYWMSCAPGGAHRSSYPRSFATIVTSTRRVWRLAVHALPEEPAEIELRQPDVAICVTLHRPECVDVELLPEPFGEYRDTMITALCPALDDGPFERVREPVETEPGLRKLLGDHGQRGPGRATNP
jgi:hypothetical protein